jgi:hypothetical protein
MMTFVQRACSVWMHDVDGSLDTRWSSPVFQQLVIFTTCLSIDTPAVQIYVCACSEHDDDEIFDEPEKRACCVIC